MSNLVKRDVSVSTFNTVADIQMFATHLIEQGALPACWDSMEKVVLGVQTAQELGLPPVSALSNMLHFFGGRVVIGVHAVATLLREKGIFVELKEDFVYIKANGDVDKTKLPGVEYIDRRTTVEGAQFIRQPDGTIFKEVRTALSFTWKEAEAQGLTTNSSWGRMPIIMLRTRALTLLGRFLGVFTLRDLAEHKEILDVPVEDVDLIID